MADGKTMAGAEKGAGRKAGRRAHMPDIAAAAELFHRTHRFHSPDSKADLNFRFTGRMNLIARRYRTRLNEQLKDIGQTQARWEALFWVSVSGDAATQSELAERMGVEGPTLVRMLNRLEQEELVERQGRPSDRRAKTIRLTKTGEAAIADIVALSGPFRDRILQDITPEEIRTCLSVLDRIMARLEEL